MRRIFGTFLAPFIVSIGLAAPVVADDYDYLLQYVDAAGNVTFSMLFDTQQELDAFVASHPLEPGSGVELRSAIIGIG